MKPRHGLVIGKFYPPHAGHHHLVRAAAVGAERVTVVVMAAHHESVSLEERVAWMREVHAADPNVTVAGVHDDHPVDYESDVIWRAHVELMREAARSVTSAPVDAVFTSEPYGEELGRRLGARHVLVDLDREAQPISGTAVRRDPASAWWALEPPVREHLALRVVLVGAESTGKTTLAADLTARLRALGAPHEQTRWVAEAGREVSEEKLAAAGPGARMEDLVWTSDDFVDIARRQDQREREAARAGGPVLVADTDAFATGVWHERYLGHRDARVEALGPPAPWHLYLLTHHDDVPFEQDGVRDGEHLRHWMTGVFVERLAGRRWQWLRGARAERLERALAVTLEALAAGPGWADPLG